MNGRSAPLRRQSPLLVAEGGVSGPSLRHLALIPDGNRRWARLRSLPVAAGHRRGFLHVAPMLVERCWAIGVQTVTLWMFSSDNWHRSAREVADLMEIYERCLERMASLALAAGVRIVHLGRADRIPAPLARSLASVVETTAGASTVGLVLGLDHGGADELARHARELLASGIDGDAVGDDELLALLDPVAASLPPLDLVIRSAGDHRLSGFMPLRSAYAELLFLDTLFPDLTAADVDTAVSEFVGRQRRFGR